MQPRNLLCLRGPQPFCRTTRKARRAARRMPSFCAAPPPRAAPLSSPVCRCRPQCSAPAVMPGLVTARPAFLLQENHLYRRVPLRSFIRIASPSMPPPIIATFMVLFRITLVRGPALPVYTHPSACYCFSLLLRDIENQTCLNLSSNSAPTARAASSPTTSPSRTSASPPKPSPPTFTLARARPRKIPPKAYASGTTRASGRKICPCMR